jgi:hypothetical protein
VRDDAYEAALWHCSTDRTLVPGPANKKWFRNHVVMELIVRALERMKLKYPAPTVDISKVVPN